VKRPGSMQLTFACFPLAKCNRCALAHRRRSWLASVEVGAANLLSQLRGTEWLLNLTGHKTLARGRGTELAKGPHFDLLGLARLLCGERSSNQNYAHHGFERGTRAALARGIELGEAAFRRAGPPVHEHESRVPAGVRLHRRVCPSQRAQGCLWRPCVRPSRIGRGSGLEGDGG
jgi:hypothetical protein